MQESDTTYNYLKHCLNSSYISWF